MRKGSEAFCLIFERAAQGVTKALMFSLHSSIAKKIIVHAQHLAIYWSTGADFPPDYAAPIERPNDLILLPRLFVFGGDIYLLPDVAALFSLAPSKNDTRRACLTLNSDPSNQRKFVSYFITICYI